MQPVQVSWDTSCVQSQYVDLYLFAPTTSSSLVYKWLRIEGSSGSYNTTLMPRWWDSASTMKLMFQLTDNGTPSFLSSYGSGPSFTATYTAPSDGTTPAAADTSIKDQGFTTVTPTTSGSLNTGSHLSKGKIAAAVIMPLLVVVAILIAYLKWSRSKGFAKRKVWTEKVDQRMSTISTDWKSMSAAGANAAIRHSIADSGNRNSSFSFGAIRPQSVAQDSGQAGVGATGLYTHQNGSLSQMPQLRPGLRTSAFENRVSRVSFADDPRPRQSTESRRSRAYHTASTYENVPVPPLPKRSMSDDPVGTMSPKQTSGAVTLTAEDITAHISADQDHRNSTFDEVFPALSRTSLLIASLFRLTSFSRANRLGNRRNSAAFNARTYSPQPHRLYYSPGLLPNCYSTINHHLLCFPTVAELPHFPCQRQSIRNGNSTHAG